jgi:hypothetical protein
MHLSNGIIRSQADISSGFDNNNVFFAYLFGITTFVWMVLNGKLSVGLFNLVHGSIFVNAENIVQLFVVNFFWWSSSTTTHAMHTWETALIIIHTSEWESSSLSAEKHCIMSIFKFI